MGNKTRREHHWSCLWLVVCSCNAVCIGKDIAVKLGCCKWAWELLREENFYYMESGWLVCAETLRLRWKTLPERRSDSLIGCLKLWRHIWIHKRCCCDASLWRSVFAVFWCGHFFFVFVSILVLDISGHVGFSERHHVVHTIQWKLHKQTYKPMWLFCVKSLCWIWTVTTFQSETNPQRTDTEDSHANPDTTETERILCVNWHSVITRTGEAVKHVCWSDHYSKCCWQLPCTWWIHPERDVWHFNMESRNTRQVRTHNLTTWWP